MNNHHKIQKWTSLVISFLCLVGFLSLCMDQIIKFFQKNTSVAEEWLPLGPRKLPAFAFCHDQPFHEYVNVYNGKELFDKKAKEVRVAFQGPAKTEFEFMGYNASQLDVHDVYTAYNGKCKIFNINIKS